MFRPILDLAKSHYSQFIDGFDPVKSVSSSHQITPLDFAVPPAKYNTHFILPLSIISYATIQGLLGFDFSGFNINSKNFVPHQIFPEKMWAQSDLVLGFSVVNMLTCYFNLVISPMLRSKYFMFVYSQRKPTPVQRVLLGADHVLSRKESHRILKIRHTVKHSVKMVFLVWFIGVEIYFNVQLFFNSTMKIDIQSGLFWLVVAPAFVIYGIFTNMLMIVYFILSLKYLHIKQEALLDQMQKLTSSFLLEDKNHKNFSFRKLVLWRKYNFLNTRLIFLCHEIQGSNQFWCRYLTSIYLLYISFITYSIYALFIVQTGMFEKSFFVLMIGNSVAYLFLVIRQCSKVLRFNNAIERQNASCLQFFKQNRLPVESILKAGDISQNQFTTFYGIRLLNDYLIDSNTLHLTFYYITSFFMLNFANMI